MTKKPYVLALLLVATAGFAQTNSYVGNTGLDFVMSGGRTPPLTTPLIMPPNLNIVQGPVLPNNFMRALPQFAPNTKVQHNFVQSSAAGVGLPAITFAPPPGMATPFLQGPTFPVGAQHALPTFGNPNLYPVGPATNPYAMPSYQYGRMPTYQK